MPSSAAAFRNIPIKSFITVTPANVLSGTTTMSNGTAGNYGIAIAASQTVKLQIPLGGDADGLGIEKQEKLTPYEQYNQPKTKALNQTACVIYFSVAGAALTSFTFGLYAVNYTAAGGTVTTVIAQANAGIPLAVGQYAYSISLKGLSVPVPISQCVIELDIVTPVSSSLVLNGISLS